MSRNLSEHDYNEKLVFFGEYLDHAAHLHKKFIVSYFPCDDTVEIFDREMNRVFLKRSLCEGIGKRDMFVGNMKRKVKFRGQIGPWYAAYLVLHLTLPYIYLYLWKVLKAHLFKSRVESLLLTKAYYGMAEYFDDSNVRIYGRQITLTDYGDCRTKEIIGKTKQRTFVLIKPSAMEKLGDVIIDIENRDFQISRLRMCKLSRKQTLELYENKKGDPFLPFILEHIVSGSVIALELVGADAIIRFGKEAGPNDPIEARKSDPNSLRAKYGHQTASNGFHCSPNLEEAVREACFFFPQGIDKKPPETTIVLKNSTCCVVKPHAIQEKKLGYILNEIKEAGFEITAMQMFYLSNENADEFLEIYKGVVSDFHALLLSFLDGPLIAMEISSKHEGMNTHKEFREFAGPADPDIARQIRPYTLRAKFGKDKYRNAIHCTDLPEDTVLELEYFFKILND